MKDELNDFIKSSRNSLKIQSISSHMRLSVGLRQLSRSLKRSLLDSVVPYGTSKESLEETRKTILPFHLKGSVVVAEDTKGLESD